LLLTAENGTLRKPFVEYLKLVYQGRDQPDSLWQSTGLAPSEIDRRFGRFLDVTDAQLADCLPVRELVLGRTQITDHGLAYLPLESLEWLDLAYTSVTDHGIERLESAKNLRRLSLEGTRITSRGLETVSRLEQLQELDLSELPLDDHSLSALMRLKRLKSLWLTNTPISDEGLGQLALLPDLEFLDLRGTQTSSQGRQRLAGQRPRLHIVAE
jgi:Leucine-rich repeat (LRR) protein